MIFLKLLYIILAIALLYLLIGNLSNNEIIIPEDSIRLRIIANSNSDYDQLIKKKVKTNLETIVAKVLNDVKDLNEAQEILKNKISIIDDNIKKTLDNENYLKPYNISLGKNYFPEKELYGIKYKSGEYESLVVTLGDGLGNNWWCVLFPPLCLIEAEESNEVEYRLYIKEILNKNL